MPHLHVPPFPPGTKTSRGSFRQNVARPLERTVEWCVTQIYGEAISSKALRGKRSLTCFGVPLPLAPVLHTLSFRSSLLFLLLAGMYVRGLTDICDCLGMSSTAGPKQKTGGGQSPVRNSRTRQTHFGSVPDFHRDRRKATLKERHLCAKLLRARGYLAPLGASTWAEEEGAGEGWRGIALECNGKCQSL